MTLQNLIDLTKEYASSGGTSYVALTDSSGWETLCMRGLNSYVRYTFSIYNQTTVTTSAQSASSLAIYSTDPIWLVDKIFVNESTVHAVESRQRIYDYNPTTGQPSLFVQLPNSRIQAYPVPDGVYNLRVVGFADHPTISASGTINLDDTELDDIAFWTAGLAWSPHLSGNDSAPLLLKRNADRMRTIDRRRMENKGNMMGSVVRGFKNKRYWL